MAFWENFGETITAKSKEMADKAKNFTDIASLKGQIVSQENAILRYYKEIGREYYTAHKDDENAECQSIFESIKKAEGIIDELQRKIAELSGTKRCATCDSEVADDSVFCPKCGAKLEDDTYFDEEDTEDIVATEIVDEDEIAGEVVAADVVENEAVADEAVIETVVSEEE